METKGQEDKKEVDLLLSERLIPGMNLLSEESFINSASNPGKLFDPIKIKNLLAPKCDSVDVVIVLRNQVDLIYSLFVHGGTLDQYGNLQSADKYIDRCLNNEDQKLFFSFSSVIKKYKLAFGENRVHVLFFEDFLFDKDYYYNEWARILDIPKEILIETIGDSHLYKKKRADDGSYIANRKTEPNRIKRLIKKLPLAHSVFSRLSRLKFVQNISISANRPVKKQLVVPLFSVEQNIQLKKGFFQDNLELLNVTNSYEDKLKKYNYL